MPNGYPNLTLKQEKFARRYVSNGGNASQAYRDVYNCEKMSEKTIGRTAHELVRENHKVAAKIKEIKEQQSDFQQITLEEVGSGLRRAAALAEAGGNPAALASSLEKLGRLAGLFVEKQRVTHESSAEEHLSALQTLAKAPVDAENVVPIGKTVGSKS